MKNQNLKTDFDLMVVNRTDIAVTFYISKKLLLDKNEKAQNLHINANNLDSYDYFEVEIKVNSNLTDAINIYKPHYIGKSSTDINYYLDKWIIVWMEDLADIKIMKEE